MSLRFLLLLLAALTLSACSSPEGEGNDLSAADQAKAQKLLADYQSARAAQNWELAETKADELRGKFADSAAASGLDASLTDTRKQAATARDGHRLRDLWEYQAVTVEAGGVQRSATIYSRTVPVEEGEVAPVADARLVLRDHPSWGRSVYLLLAQSKFSCGKPCTMRIGFDDAEAASWTGKQADSGKGPALFVVDEKRFVEQMQKAKQVRITLPKGSGTTPSLLFEVGGFDAGRYAKP